MNESCSCDKQMNAYQMECAIFHAKQMIFQVLLNIRNNPQIPEFYVRNICANLDAAMESLEGK